MALIVYILQGHSESIKKLFITDGSLDEQVQTDSKETANW